MSKEYLEFRARKMPPIPADWNLVELRELIESPLSNGIHKSAEHIGHGNSWLLDINGLYAGLRARFDDCRPIDLAQSELLNYQLSNGDILFNRVSVKPEGVGKTVLVENVPGRTVFESNMIRARVQLSLVHPNFLVEYLSSPLARRQIMEQAKITAQASISQSTIGSLLILLPPIQEQVKIAQILGVCDQAIELIERLIEALKQRKKGLMQRLLSGQLRFPDFRDSEWNEYLFEDLADRSSKKFDPNTSRSDLPCLELEHLSQGDGRILGSVDVNGSKSSKNVFNSGDVLFGKLRPYLRKFAHPGFEGLCSSEIWVLTANEALCTGHFLFYLVQADRFLSRASITSGTKMPRSDWGLVSRSRFEIPDLAEQSSIAEVLKTCDVEIGLLEEKRDLILTQKNGLMQRLLTGQVRVKVD